MLVFYINVRYRRQHSIVENETAENQHKKQTWTAEHKTQATEDWCISSSVTPRKAAHEWHANAHTGMRQKHS